MFGQALLIELFLGFHEFITEKMEFERICTLAFYPIPVLK